MRSGGRHHGLESSGEVARSEGDDSRDAVSHLTTGYRVLRRRVNFTIVASSPDGVDVGATCEAWGPTSIGRDSAKMFQATLERPHRAVLMRNVGRGLRSVSRT